MLVRRCVYALTTMILNFNPTKLLLSVIILMNLASGAYSQSGPGGVQGSSDIPGPVFWIRADGDITATSGNITSWNDDIANNNAVLGGSDPQLLEAQINGRPAVEFDGNDYLTIPNSTRINDGAVEEISIFSVFKTPANLTGTGLEIIYEQGGGTNGINIYLQRDNSNPEIIMMMWENDGGDKEYYASFAATASTVYQVQINYDGSSSRVDYYQNNNLLGTTYDPNSTNFATLNSHTGLLGIGGLNNDSQRQGFVNLQDPDPGYYFTGQIAELILYDVYLNDAERNIVANYLAEKYALTIGSDLYDDATYSYEVTAIGRSGTDTHLSGTGSGGGLTLQDAGGVNADGDYVFAGHNNLSADYTFTSAPQDINRLLRSWHIEETGVVDDIKLVFDIVALGFDAPSDLADYTLLYRASTGVDFTEVTTNITPSLSDEVGSADDDVVFTLSDLSTGYFTLGLPLENNFVDGQIPMAAGVLSSADDPGPIYWLEAGSDNLGLAGSSVTSWTDRIQEYVFLPQGSSTTQPTLSSINGKNALSFDGDDLITSEELADVNGVTTGPTELNPSDRTIFFAFETPGSLSGPNCGDPTDTDNYEVIYEQGGQTNGINVYLNKCNSQVYLRAWEGDNSTFGSFTVSASTAYVVSVVYDADIGSNGTMTFYNANQVLSSTTAAWLDLFSRHTGDIGIGGVDNDSEVIQSDNSTRVELAGDQLANFNGKIGEIVFYNVALNEAQHTVVSNYLGEKYGVTLLSDDFYTQPSFNTEVIGIGQSDGEVHAFNTGNGGDLYLLNEGGINLDGEYVFAGHNDNTHGYTSINAPVDASRWNRIWNIQKTGTVDNIKIVFDTEGAGFGPADLNRVIDDYELLYRSGVTGSFSVVSVSAKSIGDIVGSNDKDVIFTLSDGELQDGYYTLRVPKQIDWFTYNSGKWEEPDNWTLDPTGTRRLNPDNGYPSDDADDSDNVTILNGDEIIVDATTITTLNSDKGTNTISLIKLDIDDGGILDFGNTTGHSAISIIGTGKIQLNADNFIAGNAMGSQGFNTTDGGTVEFYGATDYSLSSAPTFNNMLVNLTGATLTLLDDLALNGDLTVESGVLRINDNSATNIITIDAGNNVLIEANGEIAVGTGDAVSVQADQTITFHQFNIVGDFTNNGRAIFHNIDPAHITDSTYYDYYPTASDPDDADQSIYASSEYGVAEVLFNTPNSDQSVLLNNTTEFYRIEVNKGTSQTYICEISASSTDDFKIYGRIAFRQEDDDLTDDNEIDNPRALGLEGGILKLSDNIIVPEIAKLDQESADVPGNNDTEAGFSGGNRNYVIDNDAQLWVASNAQVIHNYGWGIHVFGTLKITDDGFYGFTELQPDVEGGSGNEGSDILIDVAGVFEQSGGDVYTTQFRTKIGGASVPRGSFILTGGVFNVGNGDASTAHAIFSIPWPEMQFKMTGDGPGDDPVLNLNLTDAGKPVSATDAGLGVPGSVSAAWQVSSSEGNYEVTAGTVNFINNSGSNQEFGRRNYLITSTAPFYNLNVYREVVPNEGKQSLWLAGVDETTEDATPTSGAQEAKDLVVLNNFSVFEDPTANGGTGTSDTELRLFGKDLYVGGDFLFRNNNTEFYTNENGGSTVFINGTGNQILTIDEGDFNGTGDNSAASGFLNLSFTGSGTKTLLVDNTFNGDNINILGDLTIANNVMLNLNSERLTVNGDVTHSGEVTNTGGNANGKIILTGGAGIHTLSGNGTGIFNNLELDDAFGALLSNAFTVNGSLTMTSGILDIGTRQLTIDGLDGEITTTGSFDNTLMIATAGNASDGGLRMLFDADETLLFPIGVGGSTDYYLPAEIDLSLAGATANYININPVASALPTTNALAGDLLNLYWKVNHEFSGTKPTINELTLTYADDFISGAESGYVAGYVLDEDPFTRGGEDFEDTDGDGSLTGGEGTADISSVNETNNTIIFNGISSAGFDILNANYTAGESSEFLGAVRVFYSRGSSEDFGGEDWENTVTDADARRLWTFDGATVPGAQVPPGALPITAGDIVVIREGHEIFVDGAAAFAAQVVLDATNGSSKLIFEDASTGGTTPDDAYNSIFSIVSALPNDGSSSFSPEIVFYLDNVWTESEVLTNDNFNLPDGDYGDFTNYVSSINDRSYITYVWDGGTSRSGQAFIPNDLIEYPNLRFAREDQDTDVNANLDPANSHDGGDVLDIFVLPDVDIDVLGNIIIQDGAVVRMNVGTSGDISTTDLLFIEPGRLQFPGNSANSRTLIVNGDINMADGTMNVGAYIDIDEPTGTASSHDLTLLGDLILGAYDSLDLYGGDPTSNAVVSLTLQGSDDGVFTKSATDAHAELYHIIMNKGADATTSFSFNDAFDLEGSSAGSSKAIRLTSGRLILDDMGIDVTVNENAPDVNNNSNFTIPTAAALDIRAGTVRVTTTGSGDGNGVILNGKLAISGGNLLLNGGTGANNFIEYGASGDAEINLSSGVLFVGSQLRQNLIQSTGVLKYIQTGGTALFGVNSAPNGNKGVFEVSNSGSQFTLNSDDEAAVFAVVGAQTNPTLGTLIIGGLTNVDIDPANYIDIGYSGTVAGIGVTTNSSNEFALNIAQTIPNLRIDNTGSNSPVAKLFINPLTLSENLEIRNNGALDAEGLALTVQGDFINDGTFSPSNNITSFDGDVQVLSGSTKTTFYKLISSPSTSLTLAQEIRVNDDLNIESGILNDDGNEIELKGDLFITTTHQGTGGINFNGTAKQEIFLSDNEATVDYVFINNSNTVELGPLSNNVQLRIDGELELNSLLLIGDNRLIISPSGTITTSLSGFSKDVMISCNGSQADDGLEIEFENGDLTFTLPVGIPDKYLPVSFDFTSDETLTASVLVKPIQPTTYPFFSILDGAADGTTDGQTNTLPYYWFITSTANDGSDDLDNFSSASNALVLQYRDADIRTEPGDEADYRSARLVSPEWSKFTSADKVDDAQNQILFEDNDLGSGTDISLSGFYTAGDPNDIPNLLAQYISVISGDWNTAATWRQDTDYSDAIDGTEGDTPVIPNPGSIVIVHSDDVVTIDIPDLDNFSTRIDGTLAVVSTTGHYLGIVEGSGTMTVEQQLIPAFDVGLSTFFRTTGGELDFTGGGSYTISANFSQIRGLRVSGGGTKTLPAINYQVGTENIEIVGGTTLDNAQNDNDLTVEGDVLVTNGTFLTGDNSALITAESLIVGALGTLTSTGAIFDLSQNLELAGGTINAGSSTYRLAGDLIRSTGTFNDQTSTILFDGAGSQLISGDFTGANTLRNVTINNSGAGDVVTITGNSDVEIANRLTLTDGRVYTDDNNTLNITNTNPLAINNAIGQSSFSSASYVNGPLSRQMLESTSPYPFPVGDGSNNGYMEIRDPQGYTGGTNKRFEVEYFAATPPLDVETLTADATGIGVQSASSVEYWRITVPSDATSLIGLYWDELSGVTDADDIRIVWLNNPTGDAASSFTGDEQWDLLSRDLVSGTASQGFVSSSERLSYSTQIVTLATTNESSSPLPVEMLHFNGVENQGVVNLDWATATEIDNDHFEVQRSQDGRDWEVIGVVNGAGTTVEEQVYDFSDFKPYVGNSYYRLRQVDYDGKFAFTDIILVNVRLEPISLNVYPNPIEDIFTVDIKGINANEETPYSIISLQGAYVGQGILIADDAGRIHERLSLSYGQPAGIYILRVATSQRAFRFNVIKK